MMKLQVYSRDGADTGRTLEFDEVVFGIEPNDHVIWLDVKAIQAHGRQGTHKTKERGEVAYSRRKLYRQKGTGNARAGDRRSPVRVGGGTIFGPQPHKYTVGVNKKTRRLARRSAVSHKLRAGVVRLVEVFQLETPSTREIAKLLSALEVSGKRVLLLTGDHDDVLYRSGRNIPKMSIRRASEASTVDLMSAQVLLIQESAVERLTESLRPQAKQTADTAGAPANEIEA